MPRQPNSGFSLVEASIVVCFIFIISGIAVMNISAILPGMNANEALGQTVAQLRRARETAIAQRRNIEIKFQNDNEIQLERLDVPSGRTVLSTVTLNNGIEFRLFDDVPDSPDGFGNSAAVDFGGSSSLLFLSDGTLVDTLGNPLNGSVFLGVADHPETARAATILGATGRVRGYRWNGSSWIQ
jgi:Tfp pilus assembly protein FimT